MSAKDRSFLETLGVTQTEVSDALGCRQQAVSAGLKLDKDYFDIQSLNLIGSYLKKKGTLSDQDYFNATAPYREKKTTQRDEPNKLPADDFPKDFQQVWIIGDPPSPQFLSKQIRRLIDDLAGRKDATIVFAVSNRECAEIAFRVLVDDLAGDPEPPAFYLLRASVAETTPMLWVFEPQTDRPKVYTSLRKGNMARLPDSCAQPFIKLFNRHGLGLQTLRFYTEERRVKGSEELTLLYKTENFLNADERPLELGINSIA